MVEGERTGGEGMEYTQESRKKLKEAYTAQAEKKRKLLTIMMSSAERELAEELRSNYGNTVKELAQDHPQVDDLAGFMKKKYKRLVDYFVPKEFQKDYYDILSKCNRFQYATGYSRRSVRTRNYAPHLAHAFYLMQTYFNFGIYNVGVKEVHRYIRDEMNEELVNFKYNTGSYRFPMKYIDDIIAARINAGDSHVISAIQDAFLSENNTTVVTADIVRAVVKSDHATLHELLGKFLVAARLQEGVRQVICENADCGTPEAFLVILDAIQKENLLRFAAVKRAVATWTGVCDTDNLDRISEKVLEDIVLSVRDREQAMAFIRSEDAVHIVIGLWSLGFYEIQDAIGEMQGILERDNRVQLLAMSYFNLSLEDGLFRKRLTCAVMEKYHEDMEIVAAFMPSYLNNVSAYVSQIAVSGEDKGVYPTMPLRYLFESEQQARQHYAILQGIYERVTKKKMTFRPLVFPWYGTDLKKSTALEKMSLIAYALRDQSLIDWVCVRLADIEGTYGDRKKHLQLLLHDPKTEIQRNALIQYVADKATDTRSAAAGLTEKLALTKQDYETLEGFLKYKKEDLRRQVIAILEKQKKAGLVASITRLLQSDNEEMRLAALDMLQKYKLPSLIASLEDLPNVSDREQILIDELTGKGNTEEILNTRGYGLYQPETAVPEIPFAVNVRVCTEYFGVPPKKISDLFTQLYSFIDDHAGTEYVDVYGNECLLGNLSERSVSTRVSHDKTLPYHEQYFLPELWREFYETYIKDPDLLTVMYFAMQRGDISDLKEKDIRTFTSYESRLLGELGSSYEIPPSKYHFWGGIYTIIASMRSMTKAALPREVLRQGVAYMAMEMPEQAFWYAVDESRDSGFSWQRADICFVSRGGIGEYIRLMQEWKTEDEFKEHFLLLYYLDRKINLLDKYKKAYGNKDNLLSIYDYIEAYNTGIIKRDMVFEAAFEVIGIERTVKQLGVLLKDKIYPFEKERLRPYMGSEEIDKESLFYKTAMEIYREMIDTILDVELKRGDSPTVFSDAVRGIQRIYGLDRLTAILKALGKTPLDRTNYYSFSGCGESRKEVLSHLLQVCYPVEGDNGDRLREYMKEMKLKEERLIETAMYAPQWLDIIEACLGYPGLKSGCYYFMAHMNESFDDRKRAMIAKYTPLSEEELNGGCFDVKWFYEAYETLGEELFHKLYAGAKYISDGSKHSRARKYADAALKHVTVEELETAINEKRNKDLLMSYGIVPVESERDILHRYEYLQNFLKESKQFGAQRRASETSAVTYALKNLATTAGYSDETRLILAMETALVREHLHYFDWVAVEDCRIRIVVDIMGKVSMEFERNKKRLKNVPAALKKHTGYVEMKAFHDKLKAQYRRTVDMLEKSMEERDVYTLSELSKLTENPVTKRIVESLVYVSVRGEDIRSRTDEKAAETAHAGDGVSEQETMLHGILSEGSLISFSGEVVNADAACRLRVAHPFDLYKMGVWNAYQKYFFERCQDEGLRQPFKQVFRELYVKLSEELNKESSLMFAGNQIQPKKTVACLKGRRWIADYEEGLQKVYYKDNVIAVIYAIADWFSPADVEEPVLEWVQFMDRKTWRPVKISEVPDILYSEVMRDVDLAVSVAHAGGVDPETSHSTVEMRRVVLDFNLKLFGISNVALEKNHAIIEGSRGQYSVHLGSGVIHKLGGHQINVVTIEGSKRGKIFLPFVDEDPKTAEIMSKVLLFAEDGKIKDPYIMEQIMEK